MPLADVGGKKMDLQEVSQKVFDGRDNEELLIKKMGHVTAAAIQAPVTLNCPCTP